jgi:hypothetical protein
MCVCCLSPNPPIHPPNAPFPTGGFSGFVELSAPRYVVDEAGNLMYEYDTAYINHYILRSTSRYITQYIENRCKHRVQASNQPGMPQV